MTGSSKEVDVVVVDACCIEEYTCSEAVLFPSTDPIIQIPGGRRVLGQISRM